MNLPLTMNEPDLPGLPRPPAGTGAAESRRSAWVAALKSLVLPGLGQWHNGELDKAAWLLSGFALCSVPGVAVVALWLPSAAMLPALLLLLAVTLTLWLGGVVDAWRVARRARDAAGWTGPGASIGPAARVLWRQPGITLLILLLCDGVALPLLTQAVRQHAVASFRIPSASMAPTLWPGDIVFTDRRYACIGCAAPVRRGDVAVFAYPDDRTMYYVKRVIGLPGDRVRVAGAQVWVNGEPVPAVDAPMPPAEALARAVTPPGARAPAADLPESTVAPGHVFVLGDDRARSTDSRQFGGVPLADVVGRVRQVWWSHGPDGVRWDRLGRVVR